MKIESFLRAAHKQSGDLLGLIQENRSASIAIALGAGLSAVAYGAGYRVFDITKAIDTGPIASVKVPAAVETLPHTAFDLSFLRKIVITAGASFASGVGAKEIFPHISAGLSRWNFDNKSYLTSTLGTGLSFNLTYFLNKVGEINHFWIGGGTSLVTLLITNKLFNYI